MTPQPLVSCWSAIVEYLLTSPWAFWMSASKPAASRPSWRYFLSKFSQRGEDAASGRMTHARLAASEPPSVLPPSLLLLEQPARAMAATPVRAATARSEDFFILRLSSLKRAGDPGASLCSSLKAIIDDEDSYRQVLNVTLWQRRAERADGS